MPNMEEDGESFVLDDHRVAFVFGQEDETAERASRPTKRRKISKKAAAVTAEAKQSQTQLDCDFAPLLNGAEKPEFAALRQRMFVEGWTDINTRIQNVLKDSNRSTLDAVTSFVRDAPAEEPSKIPAALIVTGPNFASQNLLFEQLADSLGSAAQGRFARLRSAEAPNLKATLKKIIRDVTKAVSEDADAELAVGKDGRKYLDYDLEALYAHIKTHESKQVIIAFQDSEAFETSLLCDLIMLFNSWMDRIHFTLLFGIATSVELFQARLLKSTSQSLYGAQFDVVQMSSILESVFKCAVAHQACPLKLGPAFLSSLIERQQSQVAGIQLFISSLKYAYMCHFYANPLSILLIPGSSLQPEHIEALRNLPSFRAHVEDSVEAGRLKHARALIDDCEYLLQQRTVALKKVTMQWEDSFFRSLALLLASELSQDDFITLYINSLADGIDLSREDSKILASLRRLSADDISALLQRLTSTIATGNREIGLRGWANSDRKAARTLSELTEQLASLQAQSQLKGKPLRSQYSVQSRVLRTTVIAQKVQLSQDESNLSDEDKAFTKLVDDLSELLGATISCKAADTIFLHELWMCESKYPHKDVFIPRPGTIFERALSRPHDYLACVCCSGADGGNASTLPTTSVLYHLYQEAGALINVADLWSAFYAIVGQENSKDAPESKSSTSHQQNGYDERSALVLFYQGLAELKAMGFVKTTRKRTDTILRVRWIF